MKVCEIEYQGCLENAQEWPQDNVIEIEKTGLRNLVEKICKKDQCRYPLLSLRLLIHVITSVDDNGKVYISARQLSNSLDVHYDTVTKSLKYLRQIGVLYFEKEQAA